MSLFAQVNYGTLKENQQFMFSKMQTRVCGEKSGWLVHLCTFWPVLSIYYASVQWKAEFFLHQKQSSQLSFYSPLSIDLVSLAFTLSSVVLLPVIHFVCSPPILLCLSVLNTPTLVFYDFVISMEMWEVWRRKWQCHLWSSKYIQYIILKTNWWIFQFRKIEVGVFRMNK